MMRRPRATTSKPVNYTYEESDMLLSQTVSDEEDSEEWRPQEPKPKVPTCAAGEKKRAATRTAKPKEPKPPKAPRAPKAPRVPKEPKAPRVPKEPKAPRAPKVPRVPKEPKVLKAPKAQTSQNPAGTLGSPKVSKNPVASVFAETNIKQMDDSNTREIPERVQTEGGEPSFKMKEERLSFIVPEAHHSEKKPSVAEFTPKEEEVKEDFTFDEPCLKKQKTSGSCQGQPTAFPSSYPQALRNELNMNWNLIEVLSSLTCVEPRVCGNIVGLLREENTIPFIVRYRKEMINHMDADAVRDVQLIYEELCSLAKKTESALKTLKKDGVLTTELEQNLRSCKSADELDHVYSPYKKGSKLTKARKAKALGLEAAALALLDSPQTLNLNEWVKLGTDGLSSLKEVMTGVENILADMIAKDPETLNHVKTLCERSHVTIQSSVSKAALKEKEHKKPAQDVKKPGDKQNRNKDIDKFNLYFDFTSNVQRIQSHQTLAINRGESLKILTVKVNIPDRVKNDFTWWCVNRRWRTKTFAREEIREIIRNAVEDSYKRLILPFLTRTYRSKLTVAAEKESIAMFVRNLRQRLLVCPVRGCVIMGVDPGFRHGCKLAILSPTGQILHTDVVYLHVSDQNRDADKLRHLMTKYSCNKVVIGNGTACRQTESFFADLISKRYFQPLDVSYCITNEAGASIYSVSPEAVKEMPDLDPNMRSAVSIGRRVQDPLAELVKIDPKHIGIGTYQHDMSTGALKAALDGVVQECVSFVGVDINICSEHLLRHVAGLNASRARTIAEWREQNGPFINREQLKLIKGMGPKSYQQCAGFIRINPQTLHSVRFSPHPPSAVPEKTVTKKSKGKTPVNVPASFNPLDQTCIHPESYHVAESFLSLIGGRADPIGSVELRNRVDNKLRVSSVEDLAKTMNTTSETLKLVIDGLTQLPGFDIRQNFDQADFKQGIVSISDLRVGAVLTGRVENTALFGAFVDIGVGRSGLIHKSNITMDKLSVSQRRRSLALGPGERVQVRVLKVDSVNGRIALDLIRVLQ